MKILAIETSCERASVALMIDGEVMSRELEGHANHSVGLLPAIQFLLREADLSLSALDAVAYGAGPGAFTGLRLACGVAQGLGMGGGVGLVPVSSLAALALQARAAFVFAATDARMGEVYSAAYRLEGDDAVLMQDERCTPPAGVTLPEREQWFVVGSALRAYEDLFAAGDAARISGRDAAAVPRAAEVALLGAIGMGRGGRIAPEEAAPVYVRDKVAFTTVERLARGGRA